MKERNQSIEENKEVSDIGPEELFRPVKLQRQTGSAYDGKNYILPNSKINKLTKNIF